MSMNPAFTTRPPYSRGAYKASAVLFAAITAASISMGATNDWVGDTSASFTDPLNWTGDVFPNAGTDIFNFTSTGLAGTITNSSVTLTNTGTVAGTSLGQILFSSSAPARTLSGGTITLGTALTDIYNNAIVLSSGSTVTQTIASNVVIGTGTAYTASFVNAGTSGSGGILAFTGNITGGTGGTAGVISLGFGNTGTHNGDYSVSGNISAGGATGINITKRGTGVLTLTGTNSLGSGGTSGLAQSEAGTIRINGGVTTVNNAVDTTNNLGGNQVASTLQVSGGTLNVNGARTLRSNLLIDGGTFNIGSGGRLSLDTGRSFAMSSGAVNLNSTTGFGVRFGGDSGAGNGGNAFVGTQTGGVFNVVGVNTADTVFSLGSNTAGITTSYTLSGGTLDIQGSTGTSGFLTIGADNTAGTSSTTFNLSGTGKLMVRSATSGAVGINGKQATGAFSPVQVFSMTGGTLVAGNIVATNLRGSAGAANGTFVNAGGNFAAGDVGNSGKTTITGNFTQTLGTMSFDLGGAVASTAWQDAAASGKFDNVAITGSATLGGNLSLSLIDGYAPTVNSTFKIIDLTGVGSISGTFANATSEYVLVSGGNIYTFGVNYAGGTGSNDVVLTLNSISAIPEPSTYAVLAGIGILGFAVVRRRRSA